MLSLRTRCRFVSRTVLGGIRLYRNTTENAHLRPRAIYRIGVIAYFGLKPDDWTKPCYDRYAGL